MAVHNILFVEDKPFPLNTLMLNKNTLKVYHASNLADAEYLISEDPGANSFCVAFLDLWMPYSDLPPHLWEEASKTFAGWVFYKEILSNFPALQRHTVFFSGLIDELRNIAGSNEYYQLNLISKGELNFIQKIYHYVQLFIEEPGSNE